VLLATSPQFFVGIAGYALSRRFGCPFVFEVRDLWPESIVQVGAMHRGFAIRQLERVELFLYHHAAHVVTVAENARRDLVSRGVPCEKVSVVPNGVDLCLFKGDADGLETKRQLGLEGKLVLGYLGTHGLAHGLETALEAASLLRCEKDVHFLFVGEGAEKSKLIARARELALENVTFLPEQPRSRMPALLAACDVGLVIARKLPVFQKTIPSKLFEVLGARRPVLLAYWGETEEIVRRADCGVIASPESPHELAAGVRALRDPELRRRLARAGRTFVEEFFARDVLARRYAEILSSVATGSRRGPGVYTAHEPNAGGFVRVVDDTNATS
jgi:glycosyltransferase involved in cell wall biosynthesis